MANKKEILSRIMALPCIGEDVNGNITITLKYRQHIEKLLFQENPILWMKYLTSQIEFGVRDSLAEKRRVIEEIEYGTNRYTVVAGGFINVGEDK